MKASRHLASPWITLVIGLLMTFVYLVMSFGDTPYEPFVEFLFISVPGLLLFMGVILNLTAWSVYAVMDRFSTRRISPESVGEMDESVLLPQDSAIRTLKDAGEWFERMGFSPRIYGEGIEARHGRYGILPGIVLRTGLSLLMLSALMSHHMRQSQEAVVAEGGAVNVIVTGELFGMTVEPLKIDAGLPQEYLDLGKVSFGIDKISARMSVDGEEFTVSGGYPTSAGGIYWRVIHLGYAQPVEYGGAVVSLMLDVFPPGNASAHNLKMSGGQVYEFRLAPERAIRKGLITGDVFDLSTPRYELSPRGKKGGRIKVRAGETVVIDGSKAVFGSPGYYVRLLAVRDPAMPLLSAGFFLTALGILLMIARLFWYERRMAAVMHEGRVLMGYSEEFYSKWGIYKFRKWTAPLL